jgi:hypothetical protein
MAYDKDLRDLIKATKKASRPLPETVEERAQKIHESHTSGSQMPPPPSDEQHTS